MDKPRYRRWLIYYLPLNASGWLAVADFFAREVPLGILADHNEPGSISWWLIGMLGFGIFLSFWAFMHRNSE